jgi:hypothetical protein
MKQLNEYQQKAELQYEEKMQLLSGIVDELNKLDMGDIGDWTIQPRSDDCDWTPRFFMIKAKHANGEYELMAECDGYGHTGRWVFSAIGWPSYVDMNGREVSITPCDLWDPKENRPETTAAKTREPKAIARQINSKIMGEYMRIYQTCWRVADDRQHHENKSRDARAALAEACQDSLEFRGNPQRTFYVRHMEGNPVRLEWRSIGDVQLSVTTDEAIQVVALLRKLRAGL